jgi:hypothetical protein
MASSGFRVRIAGGGVAALEAVLRFRDIDTARSRCAILSGRTPRARIDLQPLVDNAGARLQKIFGVHLAPVLAGLEQGAAGT